MVLPGQIAATGSERGVSESNLREQKLLIPC